MEVQVRPVPSVSKATEGFLETLGAFSTPDFSDVLTLAAAEIVRAPDVD
jgi:hypothetical protein